MNKKTRSTAAHDQCGMTSVHTRITRTDRAVTNLDNISVHHAKAGALEDKYRTAWLDFFQRQVRGDLAALRQH